MDNLNLQKLFYETAYGRSVQKCIQCGTCSASCPLTDCMDYGPRELIALIREGEMTEALSSNTPWYCVSCYQCVVRCPREIPVTDLIYSVKQMAEKFGLVDDSHKLPDLYRAFTKVVGKHGRITESLVMARYGFRHPGEVFKSIPLALRLLKRRRLEVLPQHIEQRENMVQLMADSGTEKERS